MHILQNEGLFNGTRILQKESINLMISPEWTFNGLNGCKNYKHLQDS